MLKRLHPPLTNDFYAGFQKALQDFEQKYRRQTFPIDEDQLCLIFVRVCCDQDQSDLWKTGYQAGFFAALYHVPLGWTVTYTWNLGDCSASDVSYGVEYIGGYHE